MFDSLEDFETQLSQGSEQSFSDAILVATLTEKFGLTSFKPFQKEVINATLECKDTVVIQPTGSGKSLFSVSSGTSKQKGCDCYTHYKSNAGPGS